MMDGRLHRRTVYRILERLRREDEGAGEVYQRCAVTGEFEKGAGVVTHRGEGKCQRLSIKPKRNYILVLAMRCLLSR
jgi:hypothetical protein